MPTQEMAEIDWAALLDGKTPPPRDLISEQLSGLHTDLDVSLTTTSNTRRNVTVSTEDSVEEDDSVASAGSFLNLHDINDLLPESPDLPASKSASSLKSNVTFSESEPEVYNIVEELNLLSIGELSVAEEVTSEASAGGYSGDVFTSVYSETAKSKQTESAITESGGDITEEGSQSEEIAEDIIKTRSDPWKVAKNRLLNKGTEIPVFMVGPKKKQLHRDLSFSKSNEETASPVKSSRISVPSSSRARAGKSGASYTSVISDGPSYNSYTTVSSEDVTTISESSELQTVTKSHRSVTEVKLETPCCKCRCQNVEADLNMKPLPLFSGVTLDAGTLEQMSLLNPDKIALLNMMKAQYNLTKGLIEITSGILDSEIGKCRPKFRHTSLEETKRYIKKHQPYKSSKKRKGEKKDS